VLILYFYQGEALSLFCWLQKQLQQKKAVEKSARGPSLYFQQHQNKKPSSILLVSALEIHEYTPLEGLKFIATAKKTKTKKKAIDFSSSSKSNISHKTITVINHPEDFV
jgi:hypothetical protein